MFNVNIFVRDLFIIKLMAHKTIVQNHSLNKHYNSNEDLFGNFFSNSFLTNGFANI